ncbi:hypothetical protein T440DRAFT_177596 [Plenodomus tracheiphilus IPT5]|uniref:Uncharacterized protein n=1 Tax=Plenodomus tracheiphilus IPT5 TaxID=1408161 RepID=A0A6A7AXW5_9PLEO|nr:hypothetical protein T440DRAFT_177596 [Plenodomus tracheiphilus IPT5]
MNIQTPLYTVCTAKTHQTHRLCQMYNHDDMVICRRHEAHWKLFPVTPRLPGSIRQCRSITRNPRGVADEMQPKRRGGILVSSRLRDRRRSNAGARMLLEVQTNWIMSGGLRLVAKLSV